MATLDRLLSLAYWAEANPGPLSPLGHMLHLALGALFALGLVGGLLWQWRRPASPLGIVEAAVCSLGLVAVAMRLAEVPAWSARLWCAGTAGLALGLPVAAGLLLPAAPALHGGWRDLWAFRPSAAAPGPGAALALLALHALGLVISVRLARWPLCVALALLATLLLPQLLGRLRQPALPFSVLPLNALLPAYLLAAVTVGARLGWLALPFALPVGPVLTALAAYAWIYQVYTLWPAKPQVLAWAPPLAVSAATLAWAAWAYLTLRARGATASDPYSYVQMAVDLMRHGTLLHRFPLASLAAPLGIDLEPLLHVGYRPPIDTGGWAPTVWPAGHSVLLGLAGRIAGEPAIYLGTPLMALAAIVATTWLGAQLFGDLPRPLAWLAGSLAGLLVGTSFEQLRWVLVHMADITAQLFSVLTVALAWLAGSRPRAFAPPHRPPIAGGSKGVVAIGSQRQQPPLRGGAGDGAWHWEPDLFPPKGGTLGGFPAGVLRTLCLIAAGLALALAYWARHTQLVMALPALAILALGRGRSPRGRLLDGAVFLGAALLGALPDLHYHYVLLGSPFHPESKELALYALQAIPATTSLVAREWLTGPELAYLAPFLLGGALALARYNRRATAALGLWLVGLWAVQAPYASLRLRDLLPALPALALLAGYGVARALGWAAARRATVAVLGGLAIAALLWARMADTALLPWRHSFNNFGYLWSTQRAEFAALDRLVEPDAAVGTTLNSGAVDLYAGRATFRAAAWTPAELRLFLQALWRAGRPTYLLEDGAEMAWVLDNVRTYARVIPAATLRRVPYYEPDGGSQVRDVTLYRVQP